MAGDLWVFGYGSLIWQPGFDFDSRRLAVLNGYRRAFCMTSIAYRGTPDAPGLVLALDADPAGSCHGVAYHVTAQSAAATHAYLRERELVSYAYDEARVMIDLDGGGRVEALAYVSNRAHPQYCRLSIEHQAEVIARARGPKGPNSDYLLNTVESLEALGLHDAELVALAELVRGRLDRAAMPPEEGMRR